MQLPRFDAKRALVFNKTWAILAVALVLGGLAALTARSYFSSRVAEIEAQARGKTVGLVVARADLPRGTKLTSDNVAIRQIPGDFAHSLAVVPDQFDRVENQAIAFPVKRGELILWSALEGKRRPTFSARVEAGRRAVTVAVDEISSISGMLEPGDIIDLIVTLDRKGKKLTFPLLQSVEVMATGQRSDDEGKKMGGERRSYSTVTLDTTPQQAQYVIVARETGRITALLRNPADKQALTSARHDIEALLGIKAGAGAAVDGTDPQVPVLYSNRLPPEGLTLGQHVQQERHRPSAEAPMPQAPGGALDVLDGDEEEVVPSHGTPAATGAAHPRPASARVP
ncbi:Flp pilus assembly protein CpaB [Caldimonas brevitalea]|uniref:Flp pilus assembly protein RcpC/CpaB n=1 Tax=Caldimonas brevitalea TaxID=413882 RepID=A0A0G3BUH1_9BURK|nr:Flp pilus assembly protein CpaB [Caldimonas brevitalea]AKJ31668.1 flp pilus assembly protein RcpC/CpaB [Caldimonas brevitalea]